ncbi:spore germination protein [Paenibacillus rhizosphaerae]|uniref:Spore germination protein n=1 Tax=Paenibacillus rhizosphaerae TaxID=297318 RepID=A0A1R1F443_9BACL|nr:spore germination protein [Paenibacillus rhizosphaerae]OMF58790.1 spore germination protein [Paenibacillus rhizosphaerae]
MMRKSSRNGSAIDALVSRLFDSSADIKNITLQLSNAEYSVQLLYCQGLCDINKVEQDIIPELKGISEDVFQSDQMNLQQKVPFHMQALPEKNRENAIKETVLNGNLLLLFKPTYQIYSVTVADPPLRQPEEPNTEVSTRGPRDGFVEDAYTNLALIRRRLKTEMLAVEAFTIGSDTSTEVFLMYHKGELQKNVLDKIRSRLTHVRTKGLISNTQLEETLTGFSFFPLMSYTGRPDYAVNALLHGKFVLVMNGSPTVVFAPVTFNLLLNTSEDAHYVNVFVAFTRLLRISGVMLSLFLPGFWTAITTYHQDQIPFTLLATIVNSRQGVPLPVPLEAVVSLLLFEIFREAGMRLPSSFGQTLSVVGGLIIGQAAISAGIAAPGTIVVTAISVVSTFTLVNQSLVTVVSLLRLVILLISGFLGLFGTLSSLMALILFLVNLRSFGTPYLAPLSPPQFKEWFKVLFRMPWGKGKFTDQSGNKG